MCLFLWGSWLPCERSGGRGGRATTPAGRAFAAGGYLLLLGISQLATFPSGGHIFKWERLAAGLICTLVGVSQLRTGLVLRRRRRTELLRAVVTAVSALERRREELGLDQDLHLQMNVSTRQRLRSSLARRSELAGGELPHEADARRPGWEPAG